MSTRPLFQVVSSVNTASGRFRVEQASTLESLSGPNPGERLLSLPVLLEGLPGGRFAMPTRLDPATGEAVRREGSGLERMFFGSRGRVESPEGRELARL